MNLSKKNRIVLFVVLSFIYILFFSIYNVKADTINWVPTENFYYYYSSPNNLTSTTTQDLSTQTLLDYNFYFANSSLSYDFAQFRGRTNISNTNAQYFTFIMASLIPLSNVEIYNSSYFENKCNIEEKSIDDIYFYYAKCESTQSENMWQWGFKWAQLNENVSITNFGISPLFHFDYYDEMIEFEDIFNAKFEGAIDDGSLEQQVTNIYNTLVASNVDDSGWGASISFWNTHNASNGVITNVVTLPITLLQALLTNASSSCSSFNLGSIYNTPLSMPCINLSDYLGNSLITIIDTIFAGFIIYNCAKKFVKIFDDLTNLRDNQINELYGGGK